MSDWDIGSIGKTVTDIATDGATVLATTAMSPMAGIATAGGKIYDAVMGTSEKTLTKQVEGGGVIEREAAEAKLRSEALSEQKSLSLSSIVNTAREAVGKAGDSKSEAKKEPAQLEIGSIFAEVAQKAAEKAKASNLEGGTSGGGTPKAEAKIGGTIGGIAGAVRSEINNIASKAQNDGGSAPPEVRAQQQQAAAGGKTEGGAGQVAGAPKSESYSNQSAKSESYSSGAGQVPGAPRTESAPKTESYSGDKKGAGEDPGAPKSESYSNQSAKPESYTSGAGQVPGAPRTESAPKTESYSGDKKGAGEDPGAPRRDAGASNAGPRQDAPVTKQESSSPQAETQPRPLESKNGAAQSGGRPETISSGLADTKPPKQEQTILPNTIGNNGATQSSDARPTSRTDSTSANKEVVPQVTSPAGSQSMLPAAISPGKSTTEYKGPSDARPTSGASESKHVPDGGSTQRTAPTGDSPFVFVPKEPTKPGATGSALAESAGAVCKDKSCDGTVPIPGVTSPKGTTDNLPTATNRSGEAITAGVAGGMTKLPETNGKTTPTENTTNRNGSPSELPRDANRTPGTSQTGGLATRLVDQTAGAALSGANSKIAPGEAKGPGEATGVGNFISGALNQQSGIPLDAKASGIRTTGDPTLPHSLNAISNNGEVATGNVLARSMNEAGGLDRTISALNGERTPAIQGRDVAVPARAVTQNEVPGLQGSRTPVLNTDVNGRVVSSDANVRTTGGAGVFDKASPMKVGSETFYDYPRGKQEPAFRAGDVAVGPILQRGLQGARTFEVQEPGVQRGILGSNGSQNLSPKTVETLRTMAELRGSSATSVATQTVLQQGLKKAGEDPGAPRVGQVPGAPRVGEVAGAPRVGEVPGAPRVGEGAAKVLGKMSEAGTTQTQVHGLLTKLGEQVASGKSIQQPGAIMNVDGAIIKGDPTKVGFSIRDRLAGMDLSSISRVINGNTGGSGTFTVHTSARGHLIPGTNGGITIRPDGSIVRVDITNKVAQIMNDMRQVTDKAIPIKDGKGGLPFFYVEGKRISDGRRPEERGIGKTESGKPGEKLPGKMEPGKKIDIADKQDKIDRQVIGKIIERIERSTGKKVETSGKVDTTGSKKMETTGKVETTGGKKIETPARPNETRVQISEDRSERRIRHTVKRGETLESIAGIKLGDRRFSTLLLTINRDKVETKTIDGKQVHTVKEGCVLVLPTLTELRQHRDVFFGKKEDRKGDRKEVTGRTSARPGKDTDEKQLSEKDRVERKFNPKDDDEDDEDPNKSPLAKLLSHLRRTGNRRAISIGVQTGSTNSDRREYKVRLGDTLRSICLRDPLMHDASLWPLLARVNNFPESTNGSGQPAKLLKRGQVIQLPNQDEVEHYRFLKTLETNCFVERTKSSITPPPVVEPAPINVSITGLGNHCRMVAAERFGANFDSNTRLQTSLLGGWTTIAAYETRLGQSCRFIYQKDGTQLRYMLDLPAPVVQEMAAEDFSRNYNDYLANFIKADNRIQTSSVGNFAMQSPGPAAAVI